MPHTDMASVKEDEMMHEYNRIQQCVKCVADWQLNSVSIVHAYIGAICV